MLSLTLQWIETTGIKYPSNPCSCITWPLLGVALRAGVWPDSLESTLPDYETSIDPIPGSWVHYAKYLSIQEQARGSFEPHISKVSGRARPLGPRRGSLRHIWEDPPWNFG